MKTGIQLIRDFFGGARPVDMAEMKALTRDDRAELADAIAAQQGLKKVSGADGAPAYDVAAA